MSISVLLAGNNLDMGDEKSDKNNDKIESQLADQEKKHSNQELKPIHTNSNSGIKNNNNKNPILQNATANVGLENHLSEPYQQKPRLSLESLTATSYNQTKYAGAVGTNSWFTPNNALGSEEALCSDSGYGTSIVSGFWDNFGFNIPLGATIDGIKVELKESYEQDPETGSGIVIGKSEGNLGNEKLIAVNNGASCGASQPIYSLGSSNDLWGFSLSPSDINSNGFTVRQRKSATGEETQIFLNWIRVTVYYTWTATFFGLDDPIGTSKKGISINNVRSTKFTLSQDATINKMAFYGQAGGGAPAPYVFKGVIYDDNNGVPNNLMGITEEVTFNPPGNPVQWYSGNFNNSIFLSSGDYWLGLISGSEFDLFEKTGSANQRAKASDTYSDGPADPFNPTHTLENMVDAVYASFALNPTINDFGVYDPGTGFPEFWADMDGLPINVTIRINNSDYTMTKNGSGLWTYQLPSLNFNDFFTYQIVNATNGLFLQTASIEKNVTFSLDTTVPDVLSWIYSPDLGETGTFSSDVTDTWGSIDTVLLDVTSYYLVGSQITVPVTAVMANNGSLYINDSLYMTKGQVKFRIIVNDTAGNTFTSVEHIGFVNNKVPLVSNLVFNSSSPFSNQSLSFTYNFVDPDGDSDVSSEIRWYKNGTLQSAFNDLLTVPYSALSRDDEWNVTFRPKDGIVFGSINHTFITAVIQNSAPTAFNLILTSNSSTIDNLMASWGYSDPDGDLEDPNWIIKWYKNGIHNSSYDNISIIPSSATKKGESWNYSLIVYDGLEYSLSFSSPIVIILNSVPQVFNPIIVNGSNITVNDNLLINYTYFDADLDNQNISARMIFWFVNGTYNDTFDNLSNISSIYTNPSEFWYYVIRVSDNTSLSANYTSIAISIGSIPNQAPILSNLQILGNNSYDCTVSDCYTNYYLYYSYSYNDSDGHIELGSQIRWYKNGILQTQLNNTLFISYLDTTKSDNWYFTVVPIDVLGLNGSLYTSDPIQIKNSFPEVSNPVLSPNMAYTTTPLVVSYDVLDIDGDNITLFRTRWYIGPNEFSLILNSSYDNETQIFSNQTIKGQWWQVEISVYDDGNWSTWVFSNKNVILNSLPVIGNITLTGGGNTLENITLTYDFFDPDNDSDVSTYKWWIISLLPKNVFTGNTLSHTEFKAGEFVYVEIIPDDGDGPYLLEVSSSLNFDLGKIIVGNAIPTVDGLPIIFGENFTQIYVVSANNYVTYNVSDSDGLEGNLNYDILYDSQNKVSPNAQYRWYKLIGSIYVIQPDLTDNFVPSYRLKKGDNWKVSVRVRDEYGDFGNWVNSTAITITNTIPEITGFSWNSNTPTAFEDILLFYTYYDIDNDLEVKNGTKITWYFENGSIISSAENQTLLSQLLFNRSDRIYAVIEPFDGESVGLPFNTSIIEIINAKPLAFDVNITQIYPLAGNSISISWNYSDPDLDSENKSLTKIIWYKNGVVVQNLTDLLTVSGNYITANDYWVVTIEVFDGQDYSDRIIYGPVIINYLSSNTVNTQFSEFVLNNEDISLEYTFSNASLESYYNVSIQWYKNDNYQSDHDNNLNIPESFTAPGDIWYYVITPSHETYIGAPIRSENLIIEGNPVIHAFGVEAVLDVEGHYIIWFNITASPVKPVDQTRPLEGITFDLSINQTEEILLRSANYNGTFFIFDFKMSDYFSDYSLLGSSVIVSVDASSRVQYSNITYLLTVSSDYTFTLFDKVAPRVINVEINFDDETNPSTITFIVEVEEFGSGVEEVVLYYSFTNTDTSSIAVFNLRASNYFKIAQNNSELVGFQSIPLQIINESFYSVTLDFSPSEDTIILFQIAIKDNNANFSPNAYPEGLDSSRDNALWKLTNAGFSIEDIALFLVIILVVFSLFSFIAIKKFRSSKIVGLDIDMVMENAGSLKEKDILEKLDNYTMGVVVCFFDQRHGPVPILHSPEILRDNFSHLVEFADLSFSTGRFVTDFNIEKKSAFDYSFQSDLTINSITYAFSLDRPDARGGAENITLNILIIEEFFPLINQFLEKFSDTIHEFHILMDKGTQERNLLIEKIFNLRKFITSIIIAYEEIYGTTNVIDEED